MTFDPDVAALIESRRRERHVGLSEAVNELLREAAKSREPARPFVQKTFCVEYGIDVRNVGQVLDELDREDAAG